jgi:hypothetical protein
MKNEMQWREWLLGEGRYKRKGPRSQPRPNFGVGGPGQAPVPATWWKRLEAFLAKRSDYSEPGRKTDAPSGDVAPADDGRLTKHFHVSEFDCHDGRQVPAIAVPALRRLAKKILEPMRAEFGACDVLSGYRPADYNRRIGGATFSQHIYELTPDSVAADLTFSTGNPKAWAAFADELGSGGVGRYDGSGFVHVDNRPGRARWTG